MEPGYARLSRIGSYALLPKGDLRDEFVVCLFSDILDQYTANNVLLQESVRRGQ
jgi:hypothetical protein